MTLHVPPVLPPSPARSLLAGACIRLASSTALATIGFSNIVGTALCGLLGVRYRKNRVLALLYLTRTALFRPRA